MSAVDDIRDPTHGAGQIAVGSSSAGRRVASGVSSSEWATRALIWTSAAVLGLLLLAGVLVFLSTLQVNGVNGAAFIYDTYRKALPFCL